MVENANNTKKSWYSKTYDTNALLEKVLPKNTILNKTYDTDSLFKGIVEDLTNKPLWIKQAIYLELRDNIKQMSSIDLLEELDKNDLLQLYVPTLTTLGKSVCNNDELAVKFNLTLEQKSLLKSVNGIQNIVDLCMTNNITLQKIAAIILKSFDDGFINQVKSIKIKYLLQYISGEIDPGKYLLKTEKISDAQLKEAQQKWEKLKDTFDDPEEQCLEEFLANLGYVDKSEVNRLLVIKQASTTQFDSSVVSSKQRTASLQQDIDILIEEKNSLEQDIQTFQDIIKAKNEKISHLESELKQCKNNLEDLKKQKSSFFSKL